MWICGSLNKGILNAPGFFCRYNPRSSTFAFGWPMSCRENLLVDRYSGLRIALLRFYFCLLFPPSSGIVVVVVILQFHEFSWNCLHSPPQLARWSKEIPATIHLELLTISKDGKGLPQEERSDSSADIKLSCLWKADHRTADGRTLARICCFEDRSPSLTFITFRNKESLLPFNVRWIETEFYQPFLTLDHLTIIHVQ